VRALQYAKDVNATIVGVVGRDGGYTAKVGDAVRVVPTVNPEAVTAIKGENFLTIWIANAHNGILEMLLEIGFVGTSFFIFLWVRNFVMAVKCMNGPAGQFGLSSGLLLIGILVVGLSEEVLLSAGQIWTSLFFMMGFICEKKLWLARAAARRQGVTNSPVKKPVVGRRRRYASSSPGLRGSCA
jgi:hypothetical protein